jgi:hypothetical protein
MSENQERSERLARVLAELQEGAQVRERPFTSDTPVIGRFIVFVREKWNSVAAKWYVRPMVQQQNQFNATVVNVLQEMNRRLEQWEEWLIHTDQDATMMARQVAEGEVQLRQWNRQAVEERADLAQQVSRLERMLTQGAAAEGSDEEGGAT